MLDFVYVLHERPVSFTTGSNPSGISGFVSTSNADAV